MRFNELHIQTEHPPHTKDDKQNRISLPNLLRKVSLFIIIFVLSLHFPNFISDLHQKDQTIGEILAVLEKHPTGLANVTKEELAEAIYEEAVRYNHEPKFILALIAIESSFQNWSVSEQGAKGLMQIMPYVAESLAQEIGIEWGGDRTLFNPYLNVRIGIHYLSKLIFDFKDIGVALTAYNYGPTYVKSLIKNNERIPYHYYRKFITTYQNI